MSTVRSGNSGKTWLAVAGRWLGFAAVAGFALRRPLRHATLVPAMPREPSAWERWAMSALPKVGAVFVALALWNSGFVVLQLLRMDSSDLGSVEQYRALSEMLGWAVLLLIGTSAANGDWSPEALTSVRPPTEGC